ncbi:MAG: cation:proton antiporter, partial [Actinomycetota bacterium]|nr:cation:proton antiporter [Actinomycetota bacterium]
SRIRIAVLVFVVGLKLDLDLIRSVGPVALATGLGQVAFTSIVGFGICLALGMEIVEAAYVAIALTFSSTIIIVKLLSDKREIDSLHGRIAVGFLIVQDIVVVIVMIGLSVFAGSGETLAVATIRVVATGVGFVLGIAALMRWVLPRLLDSLARTPELLVLCAIAWAVALAALGDALGFSKEVGAFLAGVSLASTPYRESIASRLVSVRDFLLLFFFIELGSRLDIASAGARLPEALLLSVFVLVGNPLIVIVIMGAMGYRRRTALLSGLTVAQISEFSLILIALGIAIGHIGGDTLGLVTVVGIVTIGLSTYLILYSHQLYEWLERPLRVFERPSAFGERSSDGLTGPARVDIIVFGLGRFGDNVATGLLSRGLSVLGVDFDPSAIRDGRQRGLHTQYGDADDPELPGSLPLGTASWVVSTLPQPDLNIALHDAVITHGFTGRFAATAHNPEDAKRLTERGIDLVLEPFSDAAEQAVDLLSGEQKKGVHPGFEPLGELPG